MQQQSSKHQCHQYVQFQVQVVIYHRQDSSSHQHNGSMHLSSNLMQHAKNCCTLVCAFFCSAGEIRAIRMTSRCLIYSHLDDDPRSFIKRTRVMHACRQIFFCAKDCFYIVDYLWWPLHILYIYSVWKCDNFKMYDALYESSIKGDYNVYRCILFCTVHVWELSSS